MSSTTAKVFVGNLVFSTTDEQLKTAFADSANVIGANIITRGRRSLGYGFVEFATEADAIKAVEAMNKKEVDGRAINVELARARDPTKDEEVREPKAPREKKPRAPRAPAASSSSSSAPTAEGETSDAPAGGRRTGGRRTGGARRPAGGAAAPGGAPRRTGGRRPQAEGGAQSQENRALSETTLFVANVPFTTDDEQLKAFFAEHNPTAAHVVRMRNGRSRGYGFVEFATLDGQKAALTVDGKEVPIQNGTLKLSVKVAMANRAPEATAEATETPKN